MGKVAKSHTVRALLEEHGTLWSEQMGIKLRDTPSPLFRWLCGSLLLSARISQQIAIEAAKALAQEGWTTPKKLAASTWAQRTKTLNHSGYARYDERTSRMLGDTAELLLARYGGDLRRLRQEAHQDPDQERQRMKEFKGIGDVGVDIFFREAQLVWDELYPFADRRSLQAAERLDLGRDARALARLVPRNEFPRLIAALVRVDLLGEHDAVRQRATEVA